EAAVAIDVGDDQLSRAEAGRVADRLSERSVAVAEQHGDGTGAVPGSRNDQIELAVAIEIAGRNAAGRRGGDGVCDRCLERAVAVSEKNRERSVEAAVLRDGQIQLPVAIEIARGHPVRKRQGRRIGASLERSIAVAQQDRYG